MAAQSLSSLSLPITRSRGPLALSLRRLLLPDRRPAGPAAPPAFRGLCASRTPARPRGALLGAGGAGRRQRVGLGRRAMSSSTSSTVASELSVAERSGNVEPLPFVNDKHGGVIVEMTTPMDPQVFSASLKAFLAKWREQGIRGVWVKLPISLANLIQPAVEEGFWYHHAEETYLMLAYWLPNTTHTLPVNATHRVGVGAFVMNDKREVLAVQEKSGVLRGLGVWKFPTGVVEPGEDINIGAVREVKEETGIDAEFVEVLAFRQSHKAFFDKSDLFFVCLLRPLSFDITKQDSEIEACQWMPVEEFAAQPFVQKHELVKYILEVGLAKVDKEYAGFSPILIKSAFTDRKSFFYLNRRDLDRGPHDPVVCNTQQDS
ncbi:nudix hydrolase 2-like isoform X2 [Phragmites australis]|uniref:nudix hydrolase 2-like isoform X2 n=1 Tax=Phragmites australis TaxID=29695 RepID=UPI002D79C386|nr:nudix hydrolase 2-like isoform X2 [Phragmites australis]